MTPVREAIDVGALTRVEGITLLSDSDGATGHLQVEGERDSLIKALAAFPVTDLNTERPSLEQISFWLTVRQATGTC